LPPWETANKDPEFGRALDIVRQYAAFFEDMKARNIGLMLEGPFGVGKTWLLKHLASYLDNQALYFQAGTLLSQIRDSFSWDPQERRSFMDRLACKPLLILDDLGSEHQTDWAGAELGRIIDERYSRRKPLAISINRLDLLDNYQVRVIDRLSEVCIPVNMERCPNWRHQLRSAKREAFHAITGLEV